MELRMPNIRGKTEREQISEIKSYLYSLIPELQIALRTLESSSAGAALPSVSRKLIEKRSQGVSESAESLFAKLKPLIIKSADVVEAYYESISKRLEGEYVAKSDFGEFREQTTAELEANSKEIRQNYGNIQTVNGYIAKVDATIRTGYLGDEDGVSVYGLEIGQRTELDGTETFNKFARFTASRLSFYDQNGTELAYFSDRTLYVNEIRVALSLKVGGFAQTVLPNGDVIERWAGRE